jgi:hypothetical protein
MFFSALHYRTLSYVLLAMSLWMTGAKLRAQESTVVSLKDALHTEVQERGFTLARPMKVHVYAKGGGVGRGSFYAYGWILNSATREVVWQMDGRNSKALSVFQVADQYIDLAAGTYEAYFSNHGFGWETFFTHGIRNIDRRRLKEGESAKEHDRHWFRNTFEALNPGRIREWQARVGHYGMELYVNASSASEVRTFEGPQGWRHEVASLIASSDNGQWQAGFHVKRPVTVHIYAQGEHAGGREMTDTGWIVDARTRKKVWEMSSAKAQYAGGSEKNVRQVETLQLPAGDYEATYITDGSHSPADWNAAPPCDPLRYGLIVSVPKEEDASAVVPQALKEPGKILASLVRIGNDRHEKASFTLKAAGRVRVYALGERDGDDDMADYAWIENEARQKVWVMRASETLRAGGVSKNRMVDVVVDLPMGTYTVHYRTDDSHAFGDWNNDPPRDAEHYGVTVYALD